MMRVHHGLSFKVTRPALSTRSERSFLKEMRMRTGLVLLAACWIIASTASAQPSNPFLDAANQVKDLEFPAKPLRLSIFSNAEMALYKPDGPGPFPALVLHHQCGGLRQDNW